MSATSALAFEYPEDESVGDCEGRWEAIGVLLTGWLVTDDFVGSVLELQSDIIPPITTIIAIVAKTPAKTVMNLEVFDIGSSSAQRISGFGACIGRSRLQKRQTMAAS